MSIKPEKLKKMPDAPGIYVFKLKIENEKRKTEEVLYIGKATSLRDRVRSYFAGDIFETRGPRIEKMLDEAEDIEWQETDSALEALILEANLIKKHQPKYNAREKDQKSWNYVVITKEDFPRVLLVRSRELQTKWDPDDIKYSFGPYPHGGQLKEALKIIRKIFPFRGEKDPVVTKRQRSYLNEQIGIVPKFRLGDVSKKEYARTVRNLQLFFEGKKGKLLKELEREMKQSAKEEKFEKAAQLRNQIFSLQHIKDVSLIKQETTDNLQLTTVRVEGYDVAHTAGKETAGVMVVVEDGEPKKSDYRMFKIKRSREGSDTDAVREVLERRLEHSEWPMPKIIVMDGGAAQRNVALKVLEKVGIKIPVVSVVKDKRHKPREILGDKEIKIKYEADILIANSEAHRFAQNYHRKLRSRFKKN
jgi:excinuclease ABC subunit C